MITQRLSYPAGLIVPPMMATLIAASLFGGQSLGAQRPALPATPATTPYAGTGRQLVTLNGHHYNVLTNSNMQSVQDADTHQMIGMKMRGNWMARVTTDQVLAQQVLDAAAAQAVANPATRPTMPVPVAEATAVPVATQPVAAAPVAPVNAAVQFDTGGIAIVQDPKLGPVKIDASKLEISYKIAATSMTHEDTIIWVYVGAKEGQSNAKATLKNNTVALIAKVGTGDRQGHFQKGNEWQIRHGEKGTMIAFNTGQETHDFDSRFDGAAQKKGLWQIAAKSLNDDIAATEDAAMKQGNPFKMDANAKSSLAAFIQP